MDEEGPKSRQKKKKMTKQIPVPEDEEEEGYVQRKSPALSLWYLPVIDRLRALFENPKDAKMMSWLASAEDAVGKLGHPSDSKQWNSFNAKFAQMQLTGVMRMMQLQQSLLDELFVISLCFSVTNFS